MRFLLEFPTPTHVRALDRESFVAAAWDLVGRKVNKRAKLEEIPYPAYVVVRVNDSGVVQFSATAQPSGNERWDQTCLEAVRAASPLPLPPHDPGKRRFLFRFDPPQIKDASR
ncbi:TonB family protein [Burkholderia cenocepacia]|uniref:TonB family protein n=1 Tax=Burkholderia cenocepacia TaxID=95486 RepID=UPI0018A7EAAC|nr:TonB family protein [Burkholderia cenocepacia]